MIDSLKIMNVNINTTTLAAGTNLTTNLLTYQNSTSGIKIQYPSDWILNSTNSTFVRFLSPMNSVFSISSMELPTNTTLANSVTPLVNLLSKSLTGFTLVSSNITSIAGNPANRIVFVAKVGQSNIEEMHISTIKGNKEYVMIHAAKRIILK